MGKIRQLREDQLINGGSQEHIYPITHAKAVYSKDKGNLQDIIESIREGNFLKDGSIKTRHLNDEAVTTSKLGDGSVTTPKISDGNVTTGKIANESITTPKIGSKAVTVEKLGDDSVDNRVLAIDAVETENILDKSVTTNKIADHNITSDKMAEDSVLTMAIKDKNVTEEKLADSAVTTNKLGNSAVTTEKIDNNAVTNEKIADNTLTLDKFDDNLKGAIEAATGLPSDILEQFQNLSEDIADLQDSVYPITLSMNIAFGGTYHTVNFSVRNRGEAFVGDTLSLTKTLGSGAVITLTNIPTADGTAQSQVESNREIFKLEVGAEGHTAKSTSATRYICYAGGSNSSTISSQVIDTFRMYSSSNVSFNPTITTTNGQYMWIIVPSYLTVNKVTSQGFNVTLQPAQSITTSLGSFKAYRTTNTLTAQTWNLVIS